MNFCTIFLIVVLCGCKMYAQIIDGSKQRKNLGEIKSRSDQSSGNAALESAVAKLGQSVSLLNERLGNLEKSLHLKFQILGESIAMEKTSIENISSRLDILDYLTVKIKDLDSKVEDETAMIRTALTVTNKEVRRLTTEVEGQEEMRSKHRFGEVKFQIKKDTEKERARQESTARTAVRNSSLSHEERHIGTMVVEKVEEVLPRLLAAELNHFYLNMATKTDRTIGQLQRELVMKLRRIEATTKKSLSEIQEGRQDTSHLTHLHRTMMEKQSSSKGYSDPALMLKCEQDLKKDLKELMKQFHENISASIIDLIKSKNQEFISSTEERQHKDKGGVVQPPLSSEIWRGVFSTGLTRQSSSHLASPSVSTKHCLDPTAFATLEEVKQLLRSLMSKGEDLRRTLKQQAGEGIELLKHLHQRFSVLLRRINTDPGHGEALLAEVQELEHLVENSYSSILLAQNVFIESCRRIQQEQPSIEGQIVEILNKLVTNIDLGHQFNKKQLEEVRHLIEQMKLEDHSKISLLPTWMPLNGTTANNNNNITSSSFNDRLFRNLIVSAAEANNTEEKLQGVFDRISDVESELQTINWNSGDVKNIIDELLTGAKDLKGYSRNQIESLQNFHHHILQFVDSFVLHKSILAPTNNSTKQLGVKNLNNLHKSNTGNTVTNKQVEDFSDSCFSSVLRTLNASTLITSFNHNFPSLTNEETIIETLKQIIINATSRSTLHNITPSPITTTMTTAPSEGERYFQNVDQFYYDLDEEEMLMDDDHNWNHINYYDDDDEDELKMKKFSPLPNPTRTLLSNTKRPKNKITIIEDEFITS